MSWAMWSACGIASGLVTGLVPGFHVNTLAAIGGALLPAAPGVALALVAAGIVHTCVGILPATYLGVPDEDSPAAVLPAHRLLHAGQGPSAVRLSLHASLVAAVAATACLPVYAVLLRAPGVLGGIDRAAPWIILGVIVWLLAQERRRGVRGIVWAAAITGLAGILGWAAPAVRLDPWVPLPGSVFLPLLGGLFGVAGLVHAVQHATTIPPQEPPLPPRRVLAPAARGLAAASWTAVLPGVTSATATSIASPSETEDVRPVLATLSVVDTAHAVFALGVLWILARGRTGLALAVQDLFPVVGWTSGDLPRTLAWVAASVLAGAMAAAAVGRAVEPWFRRLATRLRPWVLALPALGFVVAMVVLLTGVPGLLVLGVASLVGLLPMAQGVRRIHCTGCLTVPVIARAFL